MLKILIIEDAPQLRARLVDLLGTETSGYEVLATDNRTEATRLLVTEEPNLVLLDLVIPPRAGEDATSWTEGREVLRYVRRKLPHVKVIVLTSRGELARDFLVEEEADDFFTKDESEAWAQGKLVAQVEALIGCVVCRSAAMQRTRQQLADIGEDDLLVIIAGETGTGKDYLATVVHRCSKRATRRLETLACASLTAGSLLPQLTGMRGTRERVGLLESREVGTIVLDRVEELDAEAQNELAKLLSGIRDGAIHFHPVGGSETLTADTRLVLVLTDSLANLHAAERLTDGLLAAIDPVRATAAKRIVVPPLGDRAEDVPDLARLLLMRHAVQSHRGDLRLDPACQGLLAACDFPGNVRQLAQVIAAAAQRCNGDTVLPQHLDLPLPEEYLVRFGSGDEVEEKRVSRAAVAEFTGAGSYDLALHVDDQGQVTEVHVDGASVSLGDDRLGNLLLLLTHSAGRPVELKEHRRRLGIAQSEPLKRHMHKLRQALGDTEVVNRASRFFTSHYGERYSLNEGCRFAVIRHSPGMVSEPRP